MQQKADCFYITLQLVREELLGKNTVKNIARNFYPEANLEKSKTFLVHGILNSHAGNQIRHAWVEVGGFVLEFSASNRVVQPVSEYYKTHQVKFSKQFAPQLAFDLLASGYGVGYWGDPKEVQKVSDPPTFEEWLATDLLKLHQTDGHEIEMRDLFGA